MTIGGSQVTVTTTVPGQNAKVFFDGTSGQRVSWLFGTVNYSTSTTILNPDGSVFRTTDSGTSSGEFFDALILPQTGTYTLTVNGAGANVGSLSVRAYLVPDDATTTMTIGGSQVTVTTTVPGQNAKVFFDGTSGQRVSWLFGTVNYSTSTTILNPDGSVFRTTDSGTSSGEFFDALILPQTGTYTLTVNGAGANVGSLSVRAYLVPDDATTTMTIGGSQVTVTTTVPGQNAKVFFDGTSGQRVSWLFGTVNYSTSTTILNPDGSVFRTTDSGTSSGEFFDALILPQTGTYTLTVNGAGANVGSLSVRAYNASIVTQTITIGGSPTTVTMLSPGQDANVTFSGSSGQAIRLVLSAVSITQSDVSILKPDGTTLVAPTLVTTTGKTINTTLTSTGTHTIVVNPRAAFTGSMTLTLSLQMGFALPSIAFARRNLLAPLRSQPSPSNPGQLAMPRPADRGDQSTPALDNGDDWQPDAGNRRGDWQTGWPHTDWESQPPLAAPAGETALAGTVLTLTGLPLPDVTLEIDGSIATSDHTGRFLLRDLRPGEHELAIDGRTASGPRRTFGTFEAHVTIQAGYTNALPYIIWMPRLDTENVVSIANPTSAEVVVTTPRIPGLEVHIPAGSTILDDDGNPVTEIGITPIPIDRPPFPLPAGVYVPVYFTIQPGGAYVDPAGAWVVYPNYTHLDPGTRVDFWNYDPEDLGWHTYGKGTVTADGSQVVPDPGTRIWAFTGAMFNGSASCRRPGRRAATQQMAIRSTSRPGSVSSPRPTSSCPTPSRSASHARTARATRPPDPSARAPTGTTGSSSGRPTSTRRPTSSCPTAAGSTMSAPRRAQDGPTQSSRPRLHPTRSTSRRSPGTATAGTCACATGRFTCSPTMPRSGRSVTATGTRSPSGARTTARMATSSRSTSPNGRWLTFAYDASNRITQATDNAGRAVTYQYNAAGYLWKVTDPALGVTEYTYDASNRL